MLQIAWWIILAIAILVIWYIVIAFLGQLISFYIEQRRIEKEQEEARWREINKQERQLKEKWEL